MPKHRWSLFALGAAAALWSPPAAARVKLLTLPVRSTVEVHLEHASVTLVEEERVVPLLKGRNHVDFSWANTRIDPSTIVFRVLGEVEARVLSVSYPPGEQALVWTVFADAAGPATVRISYLLGGLERGYSYRAEASPDEKTLTLRRYLRLSNQANEGFGQATLHMQDGRRVDTPVDIAETRKILVDRAQGVPIEKTYTVDLASFGYLDPGEKKLRVATHYVLHNDEAHRLGKDVLPPGKVRIFGRDRGGDVAFLGEDWGPSTPVGEKMRLFLGTAQDVVVRRHIERRNRVPVQGNLHHLDVTIRYEIESFKGAPARLDLVERVDALRRELGLDASRSSELEVSDQTSFPGGAQRADEAVPTLRMSEPLPAKAGAQPEKIVRRLVVRFANEW